VIMAPAAAEIESFRGLVAELLGLYFDDGKLDFLADVLRQRMEDTGCHLFSAYQKRISPFPGKRDEVCALAEQLTVGETYFFRWLLPRWSSQTGFKREAVIAGSESFPPDVRQARSHILSRSSYASVSRNLPHGTLRFSASTSTPPW
jgi:hypothetical protein